MAFEIVICVHSIQKKKKLNNHDNEKKTQWLRRIENSDLDIIRIILSYIGNVHYEGIIIYFYLSLKRTKHFY